MCWETEERTMKTAFYLALDVTILIQDPEKCTQPRDVNKQAILYFFDKKRTWMYWIRWQRGYFIIKKTIRLNWSTAGNTILSNLCSSINAFDSFPDDRLAARCSMSLVITRERLADLSRLSPAHNMNLDKCKWTNERTNKKPIQNLGTTSITIEKSQREPGMHWKQ